MTAKTPDCVTRAGFLARPAVGIWAVQRCRTTSLFSNFLRYVDSFSLDEIAELLRLDDGTHCEEASSLAEHKLKDVREKMADLARMETVLSELVCACHARKGNVSCPLIASLQG
ncbi:MerR family DNA-binding protein [Variovorax gossypii]